MANFSTKENRRQVQNASTLSKNDIDDTTIYRTQQGNKYALVTYLGSLPRAGKGRLTPMSDTKHLCHIRRSIKRLKGIIRANFGQDTEHEAHVTLTYKGTMRCTEKLQKDLQEFIRLLRYRHKEQKFDYVAIMEPHGHGGWHVHLLLKSDKPLWHANGVVGLCYDKVRDMWRKAVGGGGGTHHSRIPEDVYDLGSYFAAYFSTMIPEEIELSGNREAIKEASKAAVKGSRIHFYPSGFKFYRTSRGIHIPKPVKDIFNAEEMEKNWILVESTAFQVLDDDGKVVQFIQTMDWKRKEVN